MPRVYGYIPGSGLAEPAPSPYTGASPIPESVSAGLSAVVIHRLPCGPGGEHVGYLLSHILERVGNGHTCCLEGSHLGIRAANAAADDGSRMSHSLARGRRASRDECHDWFALSSGDVGSSFFFVGS